MFTALFSLLAHAGLPLSQSAKTYIMAGGILCCFLIAATLVRWGLHLLLGRLTAHTRTTLDDKLIAGVERPVALLVFFTGLLTALVSLPELAQYQTAIVRVYSAIMLLLVIFIALRVLTVLSEWMGQRLQPRLGDNAFHYATLIRKIVVFAVWVIGGIIILGQLGVEITPLVTTLGISSLAVALALQDTLANFFAGIYLMLDRPIKVGDFIRLDTGDEGFVDGIGWRSTRIRLWSNYVVVLPNTHLTSSVITNMVLSQTETSVYIRGGVGYLNDLEQVEQVLTEVAYAVLARVDGACPGVPPLVRFQEFGESNINYQVILKVKDFSYQYLLKHEYIKAVHHRFRVEGIEIAWPVRQLVAPGPIPVEVVDTTARSAHE